MNTHQKYSFVMLYMSDMRVWGDKNLQKLSTEKYLIEIMAGLSSKIGIRGKVFGKSLIKSIDLGIS